MQIIIQYGSEKAAKKALNELENELGEWLDDDEIPSVCTRKWSTIFLGKAGYIESDSQEMRVNFTYRGGLSRGTDIDDIPVSIEGFVTITLSPGRMR